jgi:hypothetical protein
MLEGLVTYPKKSLSLLTFATEICNGEALDIPAMVPSFQSALLGISSTQSPLSRSSVLAGTGYIGRTSASPARAVLGS